MTRADRFLPRLGVCLVALLAPASAAHAQDTAHVFPYAPVRVVAVRANGKAGRVIVQGKLLAFHGDTVHVGEDQEDSFHTLFDVPAVLDASHRLEVSTRTWDHKGTGAAIGLCGGVALSIAANASCRDTGFVLIRCSDFRMVTATVFGLVGAGLGAMIGAGIESDDWQPVLRPWAVSVYPDRPHGVHVGVSIRP